MSKKKDFVIKKNKLIQYVGKDVDIVIPDGVTSIADSAFSCCTIRSLEIPASVTSIGFAAFYECFDVQSITVHKDNPIYHSAGNCLIETNSKTLIQGTSNSVIPKDGSVEIIRSFAFDEVCEAFSVVEIPASVTTIERCAFRADQIKSILVDPQNPIYHSDGNCLIETQTGRLILGCNNSIIPMDGSIKIIGELAFSGCAELKALEIPIGVKKIEYNAFIFCENLASIIIPTTVEEIFKCPFLGCKGISNVTGPDKEAAFGYSISFEQGEIMTIYGVAGSCAETHANGLKIPFVSGRPNEPVPGKIQYERKADIDKTITLAFEDGSNRECSVEAVFSAENIDYIAVAPFDAEYDEVFLYRLEEINGEDLILDNILDKQEFNLAIYVYEVVTAENGYKNRDKMISFTFNKKLHDPKGGEKHGRKQV